MKIDYDRIYFQFKSEFDIQNKIDFINGMYEAAKKVHPSFDKSILYDTITRKKINLKNRVNNDILLYNKFKRHYKFNWDPKNDDILIGCAFSDITDTPNILELKKRYISSRYIEEFILTFVDDKIFEKLSAKFLKIIGCNPAESTRKTGDGGIDFYGSLDLNILSKDIILFQNYKKSSLIHFIGQAKYYKGVNLIHPHNIREFLGSILLLKHVQAWNLQNDLSIKSLPDKYLKPNDPIVLLFLTTGYITENAREVADKMGVYILDIEDLSLGLTKIINVNDSKSDIYKSLNTWLT